MMRLKPFDGLKEKPLSLRQQMFEAIKHAIITCELAPGQPINESELAERFDVSKTPVREALTSLLQVNFVEYTTNRGFTVSTISINDVQEIYEARIFYETGLFRLAIKYISDADIKYLEELKEITFTGADPDSMDAYLQTNTDFHMYIARISQNRRLARHYQVILDESQRLIYMDMKHNNVIPTWHDNHVSIIETIRNRDEEAGVKVIREIITNQKMRNFGPG